MSSKRMGGPLMVLLVGALAIVVWRFVPFGQLQQTPPVAEADVGRATDTAAPLPAPAAPPIPQAPAAPTLSEAATPSPPVTSAEVQAPLPPSVVNEPAAPAPPAVAAVVPSPVNAPAVAKVSPPKVSPPEVSPPKVSQPRPSQPKGGQSAPPRVEVAKAAPPKPLPPKVAEPTAPAPLPPLRIFVEADVDDEAGLGAYSASQFAGMLRGELAAVAGSYLAPGVVRSGDDNLGFREHLAAGRSGIERLCQQADASRLLLADVTVPSAGFSALPSAYWPQVAFTAINCNDGRVHKRQKKRLEPNRLDNFEYQQHFYQQSESFVASQGYFLKP